MAFCKYCGQENSENAKFCKSCGAKLEVSQAAGPPRRQTEPPKTAGRICPCCGRPVSPKAQFCKSCGAKLEISQTSEPPKTAGRICPCCGRPVSPKAQFCKNCGAKLSALENTGKPKATPAAAQKPAVAAFAPEAALGQNPVFGEQLPVTEHSPASPEEQKKKTLLTVIGVLGLLIVILTILSAVFIPAKIRELQSAPTPFDAEEWLEEDEDQYPPDDQPDSWIYHGSHDIPKWYYDQEG